MSTHEPGASFDDVVLPHLDAAYQLARWLLRNDDEAKDVVQEAALRAFRYFRTFTGGKGRAWFFAIVRNTCATWRSPRGRMETDLFDEEQHSGDGPAADPEALFLRMESATVVAHAIRHLPDPFHRVLELREFEGMSYRELADEFEVPVGTIMSRLARARHALRDALEGHVHLTAEYSNTPAD